MCSLTSRQSRTRLLKVTRGGFLPFIKVYWPHCDHRLTGTGEEELCPEGRGAPVLSRASSSLMFSIVEMVSGSCEWTTLNCKAFEVKMGCPEEVSTVNKANGDPGGDTAISNPYRTGNW